jgi:hypothetical protein
VAYGLKYNPFIDDLQWVTKNDFLPWAVVPAGISVEVSANREMILTEELIIDGELIVLGTVTLLGGNPTWSLRSISSDYTLTYDDELVRVTTGSITVTLPTAVGFDNQFTIKNSGSGTVTLATTLSQTIDDEASGVLTLNQYDSLTLRSDGANWIII